MESVVLYMRDSLDMSYHEVALSLNRDDRTIWTVYNRAIKKLGGATIPKKFAKGYKIKIPLKIFSDRRLSFMESVVFYMRDSLDMSYHEVALSLNRDDRTIWTVYNRALKKQGDIK